MSFVYLAILILLIIAVVFVWGKGEDNRIRLISVGYFIALTAAFATGIFVFDIHARDRAGMVFNFLYIMPFIMFIGYKIAKIVWNFRGWQRIVLLLASLVNLIIAGPILILLFTVLFVNLAQP